MKLSDIFEVVAPNKKPGEDLGNAADDSLQSKLGTYAAVKPNQKTRDGLARFMQDIHLVNGVDPDTLHATVVHSDKFLPNFHARGSLDKPYIGINLQVDIWRTTTKTKALVVMFHSPELEAYHQQLVDEHGANYPFDAYIPHITLSYDMDDDQYDTDVLTYTLARYLDHLEFDEEYEAPLNMKDDSDDPSRFNDEAPPGQKPKKK